MGEFFILVIQKICLEVVLHSVVERVNNLCPLEPFYEKM